VHLAIPFDRRAGLKIASVMTSGRSLRAVGHVALGSADVVSRQDVHTLGVVGIAGGILSAGCAAGRPASDFSDYAGRW
jgi:hypothetical protein